jgi:hypothetical protein
MKARARAWYANHREKEKARHAVWRKKNPEKMNALRTKDNFQRRAAKNFFQLSEATARLSMLVA